MKSRRNSFSMISLVFLFFLGLASFATGVAPAKNGNRVKPKEFVVGDPTLICLGFEWSIEGDDNRNAAVAVQYRKKGTTSWKGGLPLLRLQNEEAGGSLTPGYVVPNMFAGSILDLEPDTEYECKFQMSDPDGVDGTKQKTVTARTRPVPEPFAGGRILHAYPANYKGSKEKQAFMGLVPAFRTAVEPGDTILMHAGVYQSDRSAYNSILRSGVGSDGFGTTRLTKSGTPEKPIVIKSAGDGEVIFDGGGCAILFDVMGADYIYFEGLTFRNTDVAIYTGAKNVLGSSGLTVKRCRFENVCMAIWGTYQASKNYYIADSVLIGRFNPKILMGNIGTDRVPYKTLPGFPPKINGPDGSYYGITVAGQGHVICHNRIENFWDGTCVDQAGSLSFPGKPGGPHANIDFYNNYYCNIYDNPVEMDCGTHNIRFMRNVCLNSGHAALSCQPIYGGPGYFIRNIVYHAPDRGAIKMYDRPAGVIHYHNTYCSEVYIGQPSANLNGKEGASNLHFRNNLMLGENPDSMRNYRTNKDFGGIYFMDTYTSYTTSDYDGFRPNEGFQAQFMWLSPAGGALRDYKDPREVHSFKTLQELCKALGQECHGIMVDYDIFENVKKADLKDFSRVFTRGELDFRLKPNAVAVDAGCVLPNVNDGFVGKAPDLGALEVGLPLPIWGPRP
jgi:hypothetical protein